MPKSSVPLDIGPTKPVIAKFAAAQCDIWTLASRRALALVLPREPLEDRIERLGDLWMAQYAFDQALDAARWLVLNDEVAAASCPIGQLEDVFWRVHRIRHAVTHILDRIGDTRPMPEDLDPEGISAGGDRLTFLEWWAMLDDLGPWAVFHRDRDMGDNTAHAQQPPNLDPISPSVLKPSA